MDHSAPKRVHVPFGTYVLHERIGTGGMAEIFLATKGGRELVIKRILPELTGDPMFTQMFIDEARLCASLVHPNIVEVFELGSIDGQYFIAMEYVRGPDLYKVLEACAKTRVKLPADLALFVVAEVLEALDHAHNAQGPDGASLGIIHRDVSPANVMLSFDGKVKLGDFGVAKAAARERTATGILKGKFGYMSPEQLMGMKIDHRTDVFTAGILLYELLTGRRLFSRRNNHALFERVRNAVVDPLPRHYRPDLSAELEAIVLKALARDVDQRFQSTREMNDALRQHASRKGVAMSSSGLARFLGNLFGIAEADEEVEARTDLNEMESLSTLTPFTGVPAMTMIEGPASDAELTDTLFAPSPLELEPAQAPTEFAQATAQPSSQRTTRAPRVERAHVSDEKVDDPTSPRIERGDFSTGPMRVADEKE